MPHHLRSHCNLPLAVEMVDCVKTLSPVRKITRSVIKGSRNLYPTSVDLTVRSPFVAMVLSMISRVKSVMAQKTVDPIVLSADVVTGSSTKAKNAMTVISSILMTA